MEALIKKRIEEAANKICCTDCPFENIKNCKECVEKENAIKTATFALQNQWISIDEALPPRDESFSYTATSVRVLVRIDFECIIQHRTAVYDYALKKWSMYDKEVTHWMNIPRLEGGEK